MYTTIVKRQKYLVNINFIFVKKYMKIAYMDKLIDVTGSVREKWKGKIFDGDCNFNLTSICCVYKEKIVTDDSYRRTKRPSN